MQNHWQLTAVVQREEILRYTPAGLPVLAMWLSHRSKQLEAGFERQVVCEVQAVLMGEQASRLAGRLAGNTVQVSGFLSRRSLRNPRLVLHIEHIEFVKG